MRLSYDSLKKNAIWQSEVWKWHPIDVLLRLDVQSGDCPPKGKWGPVWFLAGALSGDDRGG
jgi:hypothetical protein